MTIYDMDQMHPDEFPVCEWETAEHRGDVATVTRAVNADDVEVIVI